MSNAAGFLLHLNFHPTELDVSATRVVLLMGPQARARTCADAVAKTLRTKAKPVGSDERFALLQVGPQVLVMSHGMGHGSCSIALHELIMLLQ
ncbi:MAG: hypothetical protein MHM6MM_004539 [Cercozoa sp. M6MM]